MKKFLACCLMAIFTLCSIAVSAQQTRTQVTYVVTTQKGSTAWTVDTSDTKDAVTKKILTRLTAYYDEVNRQASSIDSLQQSLDKYKATDSYILTVAKERDQNYMSVIKLQEANGKLSEEILRLNERIKNLSNGIELKFDSSKPPSRYEKE